MGSFFCLGAAGGGAQEAGSLGFPLCPPNTVPELEARGAGGGSIALCTPKAGSQDFSVRVLGPGSSGATYWTAKVVLPAVGAVFAVILCFSGLGCMHPPRHHHHYPRTVWDLGSHVLRSVDHDERRSPKAVGWSLGCVSVGVGSGSPGGWLGPVGGFPLQICIHQFLPKTSGPGQGKATNDPGGRVVRSCWPWDRQSAGTARTAVWTTPFGATAAGGTYSETQTLTLGPFMPPPTLPTLTIPSPEPTPRPASASASLQGVPASAVCTGVPLGDGRVRADLRL